MTIVNTITLDATVDAIITWGSDKLTTMLADMDQIDAIEDGNTRRMRRDEWLAEALTALGVREAIGPRRFGALWADLREKFREGFESAAKIVNAAIQESEGRDEIVTIRDFDPFVAFELRMLADAADENGSVLEAWGDAWRVHLRLPETEVQS